MGVPTSEVGYTPAMPRREDHEVHKGHVVALGEKKKKKKTFIGRIGQWWTVNVPAIRKINKYLLLLYRNLNIYMKWRAFVVETRSLTIAHIWPR